MADMDDTQKGILVKIIDVYIPFLRKLLDHLGKKKDHGPTKASYDKLSYVFKIFTEGDTKEKFDVYAACRDMLEKWHQRYKDIRKQSDGAKRNDGFDSEDSQCDVINNKSGEAGNSVVPVAIVSVRSMNEGKASKRKEKHSIRDAIEIEPPGSILPEAANTVPSIPIANIKKEKIDVPKPAAPVYNPPPKVIYTNIQPKPVQAVSAMPVVPVQEVSPPADEGPKEIVFVCASCQFRTTDEVDFMKHARTDHRTDLSLWCKNCGKCFSNAGVLVAHIKEANCQKEEMIYRCGVKDCTFETPSGQTFVHHLRHCHKGSPFIFCVHCQKIFTLPHCLILHMQNDCPFKDKNRKAPGEYTPVEAAAPSPAPTKTIVSTPVAKPAVIRTEPTLAKPSPTVRPSPTIQKATPAYVMPSPRGRAKGPTRGRWAAPRNTRGSRYMDSSDSDDPDDPSWQPEELSTTQPLRRSARWASRVCDSKNPEIEEDGTLVKKSKGFIEEPASKIVHCPCCDFSAAFDSLLRDHYVASHKHDKKNACIVCNVKFENVDLFIKHFAQHEKDKEMAEKKDASESSNDSSKTFAEVRPSEKPMELGPGDLNDIALENVPGKCPPAMQDKTKIQIPYQTAIHEKLQKDSKIKSFEDLKSTTDITKMQSEPKLKHFFKCTVYNCTYTTDDTKFYASHLVERHKDKKLHCTYCFTEFFEAQPLVDHMLKEHSKRCYQCSMCFYRAFSKPHVQIHIRNVHTSGKAQVHACSVHLSPNVVFKDDEVSTLTTTWPYVCAIGDCNFETFDPKDFTKHNDLEHRSVSQFYCYYCKGDFISQKRLISHYHLHGINNFQCTYCVHGSETREEILLHLCNTHADKAFKVHVRAPQDADTGINKTFEVSDRANSIPTAKVLPKPSIVAQKKVLPNVSSLEIQRTNVEYPQEVLCLDEDFFCRMFSCEQECKNLDFYLNHMKEDHNAINILCPYCSVVTTDSIGFGNHMMCHGPNLYACPKDKCHYYSFTKNKVVHHMESSHKLRDDVKIVRQNLDCELAPFKVDAELFPKLNNVKPFYVCPFCYHENTDAKLMKNHIYSELIYKRFQCNLCKEKLCGRRDTKTHFSTSHPHHNVKCEVSSNPEIEYLVKSFLTPDVQQRFMHYLHTDNVDRNEYLSLTTEHKCEQCNSCFHDIADWQHHWLYCLSKSNTPYTCNHCSDKYSDVAHLKYHTNKTHAGCSINYTLTENVFLKQTTNRKIQVSKLKFIKTLLTPYLKSKSLHGDKLKSFKFESKYYKCGHCNFNDSFRCNILKHISGCHKDKSSSVEKIKNNVDVPDTYNNMSNYSSKNTQVHTTNNDTAPVAKEAEPPADELASYVCGFCTKKIGKLEDLENHVQTLHVSKESYPFFYLPDVSWGFSEKDKDVYECAYCSVSQENLFHLKRHCNNLHPDVPFKVRGMRSKTTEMCQCEHCDLKVLSQELLQKHCSFLHPKVSSEMPVLTREEKVLKRKNCDSDVDITPSKVTKLNSDEYRCSSCKETFSFYIQMITHHKADHPDLPLKFTRGSDSKNTEDARLVTCDFCPYLAEQNLMISHLSIKHKNCYVCSYCGKAFDASAKIVRHIKTEHEGQPVRLVKVDDAVPESMDTSSKSPSAIHSKLPHVQEFSFYGKKPEPVDLHNVTVNLTSNVSSSNAQLPVIYLSQMFPMFPVVQVEDFAKSFM